MELMFKFFEYFPKNKKVFFAYSFISFFIGVLELIGVALTYPFVINLLSNTNNFNGNLSSPIILGIIIALLFIIKNVVMILYSYFQAKLIKSIEQEMNLSFMHYFLSENYIKSSSITYAKKINLFDFVVPNVINNYILRVQNLTVNCFIFGLILLFIVIKFTLASLITAVCAVIFLALQNLIIKPKLNKIGEEIKNNSNGYYQKVNEALSNLKSVKISNNEYRFFSNYSSAIIKYFTNLKDILFFSLIPPYITEPFIIILLFILLAVIMVQNYSNSQVLVALFASVTTAVFRLAPTIARIQVNLNGINSTIPLLNQLLEFCRDINLKDCKELQIKTFKTLNNAIQLKNVSFEFIKNKPILNNIDLTINKGEFIGIAGRSGCGKTTLADIIAGLISPTNGSIFIDDEEYSMPLKIGYVPQEFNMISSSIKDNVIFGSDVYDKEKVIQALKQAQIYDHIINNYIDGIDAMPFTDSNGLSQGQKQRIAIARALYTDPDIIILDEATSSLDPKAEDDICNTILSIKGKKTIIVIAHRLSTIKHADKIIYMENGTISDIAPFNELIIKNQNFRELVQLSNL